MKKILLEVNSTKPIILKKEMKKECDKTGGYLE